jgi:hypothetical protein
VIEDDVIIEACEQLKCLMDDAVENVKGKGK